MMRSEPTGSSDAGAGDAPALDLFALRDSVVDEYKRFATSFTTIRAPDIREQVEAIYAGNRYWPEPLIQINPSYKRSTDVGALVADGVLDPGCADVFRAKGRPLSLYKHQEQAIALAAEDESFMVTTGTGSGKSLCFFIPIVDHVLRARRTSAIVVYPMNALANSQMEELGKFIEQAPGDRPITFARYTGQEDGGERRRVADEPPDILLTNFMRMIDMTNDAGLFRTRAELAAAGWRLEGDRFEKDGEGMSPLYEAKMIHHFDHRFGTYEGQSQAQANQGKLPELDHTAHADPGRVTLPRYWVPENEVAARLDEVWDRHWLLGWRDITGAGVFRTVVACILPRAAVGNSLPLMMPSPDPRLAAALCANLSSLPFDYCARQKGGGLHLNYFTMRQVPALPPTAYALPAPWSPSMPVRDWLLPRVLELTCTAWNLKAFAEDCGDDGPPYLWDPERRFRLRCEIDAAFFHLYGVSREDAAWILDTFPVLRRSEEREHGEYRTKRVVLETHDALAAAAAEGVPYRSPLGPPRRAT